MIKLSFKNLMRNKSRTLLTTVGIIIGVIAIVSLVSISEGVKKEALSSLGNLKYIQLTQAGTMSSALSILNEDTLNRVKRVREIDHHTIQISFYAASFNEKENNVNEFQGLMPALLTIVGVEPEKYDEFKDVLSLFNIKKGRVMKETENDAILISETVAEKEKLFIGSLVELNDKNYRVVGIFEMEDTLGVTDTVVITIDEAREITEYNDDEFGVIIATINPNYDTEKIIDKLKITLTDLNVFSSQQAAGAIDSFLSILTTALWVISGISAIVGGIGVTNTMLMSVMERIQEFGVLKAIGWKNKDIIKMIIYEAIIIGIFGGIMGVLFGYLGSQIVQIISGIPTEVSIVLISQVMIFATIIGVIASIYPAYLAGKMSPVEAVRYE